MKKVLIIDDEKDFCFFLKKTMQKISDLDICVCDNAREAVQTVLDFNPDLILLDILMPDISGPELARQLKEKPQTENIPIVFLTALTPLEAIERIGPQSDDPIIITKPIEVSRLVTAINKLAG